MSWWIPKSWVPGDMVTAPLLNQQCRDNFSVLSAHVDTVNGYPRSAEKSHAFSAGQGNGAGGADTYLNSYDVVIPGGTLGDDGDLIMVRGYFYTTATAGAWTGKLSIDGGTTKVTIATGTTLATNAFFSLYLRRRSATTAGLTGITKLFTNVGAVTYALVNTGTLGSFDWNLPVSLQWYAAHGTANVIKLAEVSVLYRLGLIRGGPSA